MTISVSGLGSGLDYDSWIEALVAVKQEKINAVTSQVTSVGKQETTLGTIQKAYSTLLDSLESLDSITEGDSLFSKKTATSSDDAVSATANSYANNQSIKVAVSQLATATTAKSSYVAAANVTADTYMSGVAEGSITSGKFSIYVNGQKHEATIDTSSTAKLSDVVSTINGWNAGITAKVEDGKFVITADSSSTTLSVGSNSDVSNFADVMSLESKDITVGETTYKSFSSSKSIFSTNTTKDITTTKFATSAGVETAVTAGKFYIGGVEFNIGETGASNSKSLDDIINEINDSDAGVSAYWDASAGKLVMESTDEGAVNIDVEAGTSNFTDVMGLTSGGKLIEDAQTLGKNAKLTINGTSIISSSNTVTSDISGLTGVTLTLNDVTTSTAKVAVTNDTKELKTAVETFVTNFNKVVSLTDDATATKGDLHGESILNSIRNNLRTLATSTTSDGAYKSLAAIGITTGAIGTSVNADTSQLVIDSATLDKALSTDLGSVKKLLLGDGTTEGVITNLEDTVNNALDTDGYFAKRTDSYEDQKDRLNDKKDRMTDALESYQKRLEAKFSAMDKIISNLQKQASIFDSYFNKKSSSSSSSSS